MGCFSFICLETSKPIISNSSDGDPVWLFLLEKGEVIEYMYGNYDSYGRVFETPPNETDGFPESFKWVNDWHAIKYANAADYASGIAVIHGDHWGMGCVFPSYISEFDPNQGWGSGECDYTDEFGDPCEACDSCNIMEGPFEQVETPIHMIKDIHGHGFVPVETKVSEPEPEVPQKTHQIDIGDDLLKLMQESYKDGKQFTDNDVLLRCIAKDNPDLFLTAEQTKTNLAIDELAADIRGVDDSHNKGAAALAELLIEKGWRREAQDTTS